MQASATWDKFRKERDFHRMHHKRVAQEKNKLIHDMQILKKHYSMVKLNSCFCCHADCQDRTQYRQLLRTVCT